MFYYQQVFVHHGVSGLGSALLLYLKGGDLTYEVVVAPIACALYSLSVLDYHRKQEGMNIFTYVRMRIHT